jgi:hypothetical protein
MSKMVYKQEIRNVKEQKKINEKVKRKNENIN